MSVFQRRLASSTYALMRSFERRKRKLADLIDDIRDGRLTEEQLAQQQRTSMTLTTCSRRRPPMKTPRPEGDGEQHEHFEAKALGGTIAVSLTELEAERLKVEDLLNKARKLFNAGEESKFEKLREVLRDPDYAGQEVHHFQRAPRYRALSGAQARRPRLHRPSRTDPWRHAVPRA